MIRHAIAIAIFACGATILVGWLAGETAHTIAFRAIWFTAGALFGATAPRMP